MCWSGGQVRTIHARMILLPYQRRGFEQQTIPPRHSLECRCSLIAYVLLSLRSPVSVMIDRSAGVSHVAIENLRCICSRKTALIFKNAAFYTRAPTHLRMCSVCLTILYFSDRLFFATSTTPVRLLSMPFP